nr:MAG: hypothetical protein E4H34_04365 [Hyphomicrobiales bacterium]
MRNIAGVIVLGAGLMTAPAISVAADSPSQFMVMGVGYNSCEAWTGDRNANEAISRVKEQWVFGYVTAVNNWLLPGDRGAARDLAEGANAAGVLAWMDEYCLANPGANVGNAVALLVRAFQDRWLAAHPAID